MARGKRQWPPVSDPLPNPVMDNHTHLPLHEGEIPAADGYKMPLEEQLRRASEVGVTSMITVGCALPDLEPTLELSRRFPQVRAALAIHPNEAALHAGHLERSPDGFDHELDEHHHVPLVVALERVSELARDGEVVAIGETGLDFFRTGEPGREAQEESFVAHLEMGRVLGLPVQIHDRDAHDATVQVLHESASDDQAIVFHSFSGGKRLAEEVRKNGWYASFSGQLTFSRNDELRAAFLEIPKSRVLVETDAPYLTPVPYRGNPNASYVMVHTVAEMARLWELPVADACEILMDNSRALYGQW